MVNVLVAERAGTGARGEHRPSEDRVVVLGNAVLVLDGATSLVPGRSGGGGWYASVLSERLARALDDDPGADLGAILRTAIQGLVTEHGLVPGDSPSSTVAIARWTAETVDALVLADSPVVAFGADGTRPLVDGRLRALPRSRHTYQNLLRAGSGYGDAVVEALRTGMATTTARYRNADDGFWVAEADPAAADHAVRARWPRSGIDGLLLATDGVSCGVDDYGLLGWDEAFAVARARGPEAVLDLVRRAEESDPGGVRWPRPKPHDDQALVLVDGL